MKNKERKARKSDNRHQETSQKRVYQQIKAAIIDGTIAFGQHLSEESLAKMFQVSRTPVREAIFQLTQEGLISKKANSYLYIKRPSEEELDDLFDLRIIINNFLVDKLMAMSDKHVLDELERNIEKCKTVIDDKVSLNYALNEYHSIMCAISKTPYVERFLCGLVDHMLMSRAIALEVPGVGEMLIADHEAVVVAMKAGKKAEAKKILREHTLRTKQKVLQIVLEDRLREMALNERKHEMTSGQLDPIAVEAKKVNHLLSLREENRGPLEA